LGQRLVGTLIFLLEKKLQEGSIKQSMDKIPMALSSLRKLISSHATAVNKVSPKTHPRHDDNDSSHRLEDEMMMMSPKSKKKKQQQVEQQDEVDQSRHQQYRKATIYPESVEYSSRKGAKGILFVEEEARRPQEESGELELDDEVEEFKVIEGLGMGGFGTVMKAEVILGSGHDNLDDDDNLSTSSSDYKKKKKEKDAFYLAMKVLRKNERSLRSVSNEIFALQTLRNHERKNKNACCLFIQRFHNAYENESALFILSQFISGGDAFHYLSQRIRFTENQVRIILAELYVALQHVHSCGLIHCDVKAENVMFDHRGHVKLVDFGLSTNIILSTAEIIENSPPPRSDDISIAHEDIVPRHQQRMKVVGSLPYMAPELLHDSLGGRHTDWWAYGVFAYELFTGCSPWMNLSSPQAIVEEITFRQVGLPRSFSRDARSLFEGFVMKDFRWRSGTTTDSNIEKLPFFKIIDFGKLRKGELLGAIIIPKMEKCTEVGDRNKAMNAFADLMNSPPSLFFPTPKELELKPISVVFDEGHFYCSTGSDNNRTGGDKRKYAELRSVSSTDNSETPAGSTMDQDRTDSSLSCTLSSLSLSAASSSTI
jgi:serine/threonine protein kinase